MQTDRELSPQAFPLFETALMLMNFINYNLATTILDPYMHIVCIPQVPWGAITPPSRAKKGGRSSRKFSVHQCVTNNYKSSFMSTQKSREIVFSDDNVVSRRSKMRHYVISSITLSHLQYEPNVLNETKTFVTKAF